MIARYADGVGLTSGVGIDFKAPLGEFALVKPLENITRVDHLTPSTRRVVHIVSVSMEKII